MNAQAALPYARWLRDLGEPIVLLAIGREPDDEQFAHVEYVESLTRTGLLEVRAVELSETYTFRTIFAQSEHDLLRAARLRELFGLGGQSLESARAFRDKIGMKTLARAAGIPVADFTVLEYPLDLVRFIAERGYPCVVKPRWGSGSRGLRVIRNAGELREFLRDPLPESYMVESFVEGPTFHVDGHASDARIEFVSAAKYVNSCISHQSGESYGSALLAPSDALGRRLVAMTQAVLQCLPRAPQLAFHAEFFVDRDDRVVLCEVAARPGGGGIVDAIEVAHGVNLYELWVRRSCGLTMELPPAPVWSAAGRLWVPPRRGRLASIPSAVPFDWVIDYRPNAAAGDSCVDPEFCTANIASFTLAGRDAAEVECHINYLDRWFRNQLRWLD